LSAGRVDVLARTSARREELDQLGLRGECSNLTLVLLDARTALGVRLQLAEVLVVLGVDVLPLHAGH
jgi:hypothetical protein